MVRGFTHCPRIHRALLVMLQPRAAIASFTFACAQALLQPRLFLSVQLRAAVANQHILTAILEIVQLLLVEIARPSTRAFATWRVARPSAQALSTWKLARF